jgi:hypothetical protein
MPSVTIPDPYRAIGPAERKRLHQVKRYLAAHWPTPFPVKLRIERVSERHDFVGITYRVRDSLLIRLDSRMQFGYAVETLLHEWAHAATWPASIRFESTQVKEEVPLHDPPFQGTYGSIIHAFEDGDAYDDSKEW